MSKKSILLQGIFICFLSGMIILGNVKILLAESLLDQVQPNEIGWYTIISEEQICAQTFIPGLDGSLDKVSLLLRYWSSSTLPGDLIVEITPTSLGTACLFGCNHGTVSALLPTDEVLGTTTVLRSSIPADEKVWVDVLFAEPIELIAGVTYAIKAYTTTPEEDRGYQWLMDGSPPSPSDPYPFGESMAKRVGDWSVARPYLGGGRFEDFAFKTYMENVDVCECEGNFDNDEDQDGSDAANFKLDFGRSGFFDPCTNEDSCNGDFDCDVDVDGTDAAVFKEDFGRSPFFNPCPSCPTDPWCTYP